MVDKALISEAKGNKRYGIKERSETYKKLNSIVFYIAIPLMVLWTIIAFGGICTRKVGYTSFANNVYYTLKQDISITEYKKGDMLTIRNAELFDVTKGDIVCFELIDETGRDVDLYFLEVCSSSSSINAAVEPSITVRTDVYDEFLYNNYGIGTSAEGSSIATSNDVRFIGKVTGKSLFFGQFLEFNSNIVVIIFLVIIPAIVILTFQFINLSDGIKVYIKQRQVGKAKNKQRKQVDNRDKIKR